MKDLKIDLRGGDHAVLLIHGLTGSPFELNPLARQLYRNGFTVKAPCLAGHGQTLDQLTMTTWQDWYQTIHDEFKELKKQYKTVSVSGLCMGALLALYLAHEEGDGVSSIATLSTTLFYDGWSLPWYKFLLPLFYLPPLKYLASYEERPPYGIKNERIRKQIEIALKRNTIAYSSFPTQSMHELFKLVKVVKKTMHQVKVPTLILHALEDDVASIKNANYIEAHIGTSNVRKIFLDNTYHMLPLDNQKERVGVETIRFFRENINSFGHF